MNSQVLIKLPVTFPKHNLRLLHQLLLRPGGHVGGGGGARVGGGHHLLPHLPDLQLQAHLVGEDLDVLGLERGGRLVGGEEALLVEQLHHQLSSAVQGFPQARRPISLHSCGARRLWRACHALRVLVGFEHFRIEVGAEEGVSCQVGLGR